ncbi:hypothetical protein LCGC14_0662160 [marine sediment metagenome]|uniref:Uncharacterized protein n=1 Tax=marine sediment metagenome TaxID=412755 RepID=A0A0F9QT96_9ZZZZ
MDKIDKIIVTKLSLIFSFLLMLGITMILLFSGMGSGDFNVMRQMFLYIVIIILMGIFAIIVKYVGDIIVIVLKSREQ